MSSFRSFAKRARASAAGAQLPLTFSKLNDAIAWAVHGRTYSPVLAAEAAGTLVDGTWPPPHLQDAAARYGIDPTLLRQALLEADFSASLPYLTPQPTARRDSLEAVHDRLATAPRGAGAGEPPEQRMSQARSPVFHHCLINLDGEGTVKQIYRVDPQELRQVDQKDSAALYHYAQEICDRYFAECAQTTVEGRPTKRTIAFDGEHYQVVESVDPDERRSLSIARWMDPQARQDWASRELVEALSDAANPGLTIVIGLPNSGLGTVISLALMQHAQAGFVAWDARDSFNAIPRDIAMRRSVMQVRSDQLGTNAAPNSSRPMIALPPIERGRAEETTEAVQALGSDVGRGLSVFCQMHAHSPDDALARLGWHIARPAGIGALRILHVRTTGATSGCGLPTRAELVATAQM